MFNCFEVLARSAIVSTTREGCDQLGVGYASPLHNVKLEWSSGMNNPGEAGYESSSYQPLYMVDSPNGGSGLDQHYQDYYSKQVSQGEQHVSTESSMVINSWSSSDGGRGIVENTRMNQMKPVEEQWWVDVLAPGSMVVPATLSQHSNIALNACVEFGVPRQHVEDLDSMLLMQPVDPTIMKWLLGDGHTHGQGDIQPAQSLRDMDSLMFEQDSWSSNQHQSGPHFGDDSLSRQILLDPTPKGTFSSALCSSTSLSPSSIPNSDPKFLHTHACLPRALSLPSHLHDISLNSPKRIGVSVSPSIASAIASMDGPGGHSFSAPSSFASTMLLSPNSTATSENYAQSLLVGNSTSEGRYSHVITYAAHQSRLVEEGPFVTRGRLSSSPPAVHAVHSNLSSLMPAYYQQEADEEFEQRSIFQPSFSSLASSHSQNSQVKFPAVLSSEYPHQQQLPWNAGRMSSQWHQPVFEKGTPNTTGDWKPETLKNRTGGALSPLSSVPGFIPRGSSHAGGSLHQVGDEREHEDVTLDTGQMEAGVIPEGGLAIVNLLLRAAEAVDIGNAEVAKAILARLNQHISPLREKSIHRVAHHFREALVTRIMGADNSAAQFSLDRTLHPLEEFHKINAYVRFCEISPYPKFAHFTANQAILEVLEGEEAMHVIDFQMGAGAQWASFLQDIASLRAAGKSMPTVRLTAVGTRADEIHATGANLCNFARMMNIALEFQAVVTRPECLDVSMLGLRDNEAVAGNFIFSLHELLDGESSMGLSAVLKSMLEARPKIVTTVEQEANHSGPFFQQRFSEALQYYVFLFDSLTSSLEAGADSSVNSSIESYLLAPEIMNIVACEGVARVERHERLEQWRKRMLAAGFSPRALSEASQFQAEKLVTQISARGGSKSPVIKKASSLAGTVGPFWLRRLGSVD